MLRSRTIAARAVTTYFMRRIIRLATLITVISLGIGIVITAALANFFSAWWWLLAIIFIGLFCIFLVFRLIATVIASFVYRNRFTKQQSHALGAFVDKIQAVLEARATPPVIIVLICLKDILLHQDIVTVKRIIRDTASLRHDYQELEKLF